MVRPRTSDTKDRIRAVALELFAEQGVQRTSLRQIAERLGLTKPALYYHFSSREELVRSLIQPLVDDVESFLARVEAEEDVDPRTLLAGYYDLYLRHRRITALVAREPDVLGYLDFAARVADWRLRLIALLAGPDPSLEDRARAVVAIGGLADCTLVFIGMPPEELRSAALNAACAALGPLLEKRS
ncbi:TetR/AcrR family transcriptional regulator [Marinactinospora thermotolerans]|uniref:Transcriptional regulator, TetR family n=1 Tax=Marinactinospora thermotolerans DSM 45154 TaxID=1122192 RepID=A0A1T4T4Y2_9ACTN|nr:TetR/AcrR family transcriptional regulator [Marinactinospora thermotolerans]SKA35311.1 transcriptional regulator, TetR family [Marinactinospora thermotolerans DSM 45154]